MQTKILIGILLIISLIVGIGIVFAHGNGESESNTSNSMEEMMESMMDDEDGDMPMRGMMGMMSNIDEESMEEMMESMMDDEEMKKEMLEHLENCPMMKRFGSS